MSSHKLILDNMLNFYLIKYAQREKGGGSTILQYHSVSCGEIKESKRPMPLCGQLPDYLR